jgi:hypothetical protein
VLQKAQILETMEVLLLFFMDCTSMDRYFFFNGLYPLLKYIAPFGAEPSPERAIYTIIG